MSTPLFMATLHAGTPTVVISDARSLPTRSLAFLRYPDTPDLPPQVQLTRQHYGLNGLPSAAFGPRTLADLQPDMTQVFTLSGAPVLTDSVDAGCMLALADEAGRPAWACMGLQCRRHRHYLAVRGVAVAWSSADHQRNQRLRCDPGA